MLFRYDFNSKLDLVRFCKQANYHIGNMRDLTYNIFLPNYKIVIEILSTANKSAHYALLFCSDLKRDDDGSIINETIISPMFDSRFMDISFFKELYIYNLNYKATFYSDKNDFTIGKISLFIKILFRFEKLKAFL